MTIKQLLLMVKRPSNQAHKKANSKTQKAKNQKLKEMKFSSLAANFLLLLATSTPFACVASLRGAGVGAVADTTTATEPASAGESEISSASMPDTGHHGRQLLFLLSERAQADLAEVVCSKRFKDTYGMIMGAADFATQFIDGAGGVVGDAGLSTVGVGVSLVQTTCTDTEVDPFAQLQDYLVQYIKDAITANNNAFVSAEINDNLSYLMSLLEDYVNVADGFWTDKSTYMDDIVTYALKMHSDLFTPEDSMGSTLEAMGTTEDLWKGFTFNVAVFFAQQYIGIELQRLANYNELYSTTLTGDNLLTKYQDLLTLMFDYESYFTSDDTWTLLKDWRKTQFTITYTEDKVNDDCPQKRSNGSCRTRSTCGCIVDFTIADEMTGLVYTVDDELYQLCFAEAYVNFWGTMVNDFSSAQCSLSDETASENANVDSLIDGIATDWTNNIWQPSVWTDYVKTVFNEGLDAVLGYQLRFGDENGLCLTNRDRNTDVEAFACSDSNVDQQWTLEGFSPFKLIDPSDSSTQLTLGNFYYVTTSSTNLGENVGYWYFVKADEEAGSVYLKNAGNDEYVLAVSYNHDFVYTEATTFNEADINQEWFWDSDNSRIVWAGDDNLCLARPDQSIAITDTGTEAEGGMILVDCDAGQSGYSHDWNIEYKDEYWFRIVQRAGEYVLGIGSSSTIQPQYRNKSLMSQFWTWTDDGYLHNKGEGQDVYVGDDNSLYLTSDAGDAIVKIPTMLDSQFDAISA